MSHSDAIKQQIREHAEELGRLHRCIHETFLQRDASRSKREEWSDACKAFHQRYDQMAFPGGYSGAFERLVAGDPDTVEAALCFLEVRPYFFRSGYMFKDLLRKAKRAPLDEAQRARLQAVLDGWQAWKDTKRVAG